jgi:hypothetical protein
LSPIVSIGLLRASLAYAIHFPSGLNSAERSFVVVAVTRRACATSATLGSNDTGVREVYIAGGLTQHRQITKGGGDWPRWAVDGKSLYFSAKGGLYSVRVADGLVAGERTLVYGTPFDQSDYELPDYAVSPDGRLLIIEASKHGPTVKEVSVILNCTRCWITRPVREPKPQNDAISGVCAVATVKVNLIESRISCCGGCPFSLLVSI